jgi:hypothetical protein
MVSIALSAFFECPTSPRRSGNRERTFTRTLFTNARATWISLDGFRRWFRWLKASVSSRKDRSPRVNVGQISPPGTVKEGGGRGEQRGGYLIPRELRRNQPNPTLVGLGKNSRRSRFQNPSLRFRDHYGLFSVTADTVLDLSAFPHLKGPSTGDSEDTTPRRTRLSSCVSSWCSLLLFYRPIHIFVVGVWTAFL